MSIVSMLYSLGAVAVITALRLGSNTDDPVFQAQIVGWILLLFSVILTLRQPTENGGEKTLRSGVLLAQTVGIASLLIGLGLSLDFFGADEVAEQTRLQTEVLIRGATIALFVLSVFPLFTLEWLRQHNPGHIPARSVPIAGFGGLSLALAILLLVPLNYLAGEFNARWDHSYFKTAEPGDLTRGTIESLSEPITAYLFFPHTSDVTEEIRTYFDALKDPNLSVAYVDQALESELAKELRVQKNGTIALVRGAGEDAQVQRIRIGDEMDKAKRKLRSLDEEVSKALAQLARGQRVAYVVVGHGEMYWKRGAGILPARTIDGLKQELRRANFKVKELGPAQGLASEVPEDADLVLLLGPTDPFLPEEVAALDAYRSSGGALLVALDPGSESDLDALLAPVGLGYDPDQMLVGDANIWVATRRITDRYNIFTNKASTHPAVTTLSRNASTRALLVPLAAPLQTRSNPPFKVDIIMRTLPEVWVDSTANLRMDGATETRKSWPLAAAVSGDEENAFRIVVIGDATWSSDLVLPLSKGNQEFLRDAVAWLVDDEAGGGTVNDEEDVKIRHTKKDEVWMFYSASMLVPVLLLVFGLVRVRSRREGGAA